MWTVSLGRPHWDGPIETVSLGGGSGTAPLGWHHWEFFFQFVLDVVDFATFSDEVAISTRKSVAGYDFFNVNFFFQFVLDVVDFATFTDEVAISTRKSAAGRDIFNVNFFSSLRRMWSIWLLPAMK